MARLGRVPARASALRRHAVALALAGAAALLCPAPPAAAETPVGAVSGLPVPRFVTLKSERVNVRGGPTKEHEVVWVFTRSGLPIEVTAEFDNWRRIRDWEGAEGWVYHSLLSGRRNVLVMANPKDRGALVPLHAAAAADSAVVARLQPGVVAAVRKCAGGWCRLAGSGFDGWMPQERLFGVYPDETVD